MKRIILALAMVALVIGFTQCRKPNIYGTKQHIVITTTLTDNSSKLGVDYTTPASELKLAWEPGDEIKVNDANGYIGSLHTSGAGTTATFEGDITYVSGDLLFYVGETPTHTGQTATALAAANIRLEATSPYNESGEYKDIHMMVPYAILKLDLSIFGKDAGETVCIKAGGSTIASVANVLPTSTVMYVSIPTANVYGAASPSSAEYTFEGNGMSLDYTWTLVRNTYYTKGDGEGAPTGAAIVIAPGLPALPSSHGSNDNFNADGVNP